MTYGTYKTRVVAEPLDYTISYTLSTVGDALLSSFKSHVRVDYDDEDESLVRFINVAATELQEDSRTVLLQTTVTEYYDVWPWDYVDAIRLHRAPLSSLTSIKYYDPDDNLQTWGSTNYDVELVSPGGRISVAEGATSVSPNVDVRYHPVEIAYVAGYGTTVASIPDVAVHAIFTRATYLYGPGRDGVPEYDEHAVNRCWNMALRTLQWSY